MNSTLTATRLLLCLMFVSGFYAYKGNLFTSYKNTELSIGVALSLWNITNLMLIPINTEVAQQLELPTHSPDGTLSGMVLLVGLLVGFWLFAFCRYTGLAIHDTLHTIRSEQSAL